MSHMSMLTTRKDAHGVSDEYCQYRIFECERSMGKSCLNANHKSIWLVKVSKKQSHKSIWFHRKIRHNFNVTSTLSFRKFQNSSEEGVMLLILLILEFGSRQKSDSWSKNSQNLILDWSCTPEMGNRYINTLTRVGPLSGAGISGEGIIELSHRDRFYVL